MRPVQAGPLGTVAALAFFGNILYKNAVPSGHKQRSLLSDFVLRKRRIYEKGTGPAEPGHDVSGRRGLRQLPRWRQAKARIFVQLAALIFASGLPVASPEQQRIAY
jgi:hypothetical protein